MLTVKDIAWLHRGRSTLDTVEAAQVRKNNCQHHRAVAIRVYVDVRQFGRAIYVPRERDRKRNAYHPWWGVQ